MYRHPVARALALVLTSLLPSTTALSPATSDRSTWVRHCISTAVSAGSISNSTNSYKLKWSGDKVAGRQFLY
jgi:hypothetical protein